DRSFLAGGNEDRVVAEPFVAARLVGDPALEDPGAAQLLPGWRKGDELADIAGPSALVLDVAEFREQALDRLAAAEARRTDPRAAAEAVHLEPGVLAEHPGVLVDELRPVPRLAERVLVVGGTCFGRIVLRVEEAELPVPEHACQLAQLVLVPGGEPDSQSAQRTSSTCSTSASFDTSFCVSSGRASSSVSSSVRRSPSCLISIVSTRASASTASITPAGLWPAGSCTSSRPLSPRKRWTTR